MKVEFEGNTLGDVTKQIEKFFADTQPPAKKTRAKKPKLDDFPLQDVVDYVKSNAPEALTPPEPEDTPEATTVEEPFVEAPATESAPVEEPGVTEEPQAATDKPLIEEIREKLNDLYIKQGRADEVMEVLKKYNVSNLNDLTVDKHAEFNQDIDRLLEGN